VWAVAAMLDVSPAALEEACERLANRQQFIRSVGIYKAADGSLRLITNSDIPSTGKLFIVASPVLAAMKCFRIWWPDRMRRPVSSAGCDMLPMRNALEVRMKGNRP
jgi:hypothetical protein